MSNEYKSEVGNTQGAFFKGPVFYIVVVLLVVAGLFGLGKLTTLNDNKEPIKIESQASLHSKDAVAAVQNPSAEPTTVEGGGEFVASKNGKKYFSLTCGAAKTIKAENRIYFATQDEAKKAGYEPSAMCKDL